jgi:hypothetical protein
MPTRFVSIKIGVNKMEFPKDILSKIEVEFYACGKAEYVKAAFEKLSIRSDESLRVIRCILALSESDADALILWIKQANEDYRNIILYAEYDNRNVRKFNFNYPFGDQVEYEMGE